MPKGKIFFTIIKRVLKRNGLDSSEGVKLAMTVALK
jgi:hypothetical protein